MGGQETLRPDVGLDPARLGAGKPHPRFRGQANRFIGKLKSDLLARFGLRGALVAGLAGGGVREVRSSMSR